MKKILLFSLIALTFGFAGCSKDEDSGEIKFIELNTKSCMIKPKDCGTKSDDELVANVADGKINARFVGVTQITGGKNIYEINVTHKNPAYFEPVLKKGDSRANVKSYMSGEKELLKEDDNLVYKGNGIEDYYFFVFEDNKLTGYSVLVNILYMDKVIDFLTDCYVPVGVQDDKIILARTDAAELISPVVYSTKYLAILYVLNGDRRKYKHGDGGIRNGGISFTPIIDPNDTRNYIVNDEYMNIFDTLKKALDKFNLSEN